VSCSAQDPVWLFGSFCAVSGSPPAVSIADPDQVAIALSQPSANTPVAVIQIDQNALIQIGASGQLWTFRGSETN
jgi:hypothetical protein